MVEFVSGIVKARTLNQRRLLKRSISLILVVTTAYMVWMTLKVLTYCENPLFIIASGGGYYYNRGDILFLTCYENQSISPGDIISFKLKDIEIPIAHRVIAVQEMENNDYYILTKGDENVVDDRGLYEPGRLWLHKEDVVGKVEGYFPDVGLIGLILLDYPLLKFIILGVIILSIMFKQL